MAEHPAAITVDQFTRFRSRASLSDVRRNPSLILLHKERPLADSLEKKAGFMDA